VQINRNLLFHGLTAFFVVGFFVTGPGAFAADDQDEHADHDMSGHDMAGHSTERDAEGRRLHDMKHEMSPEILAELREKVLGWENITPEEAALSMVQMGPNYEWYISDSDTSASTGVLILLHGFRDRGDKLFKDRVQPFGEIFPMAMSFGMSMMMSQHIQLGIDDLVAAGATNIVVVPIVSTEYNTMIRQWHYIFGLEEEPAYATVPQIQTNARIAFAEPPGDDPFVAEILVEYASEISTDPKKEVVIIVAHGPSLEADNQLQLELMRNLAEIMQEDGGFSAVYAATLQDDAPPEVRSANVEKLRDMIESATADGKEVLIVTNLMGAYTIQSKLRKDLDGLDYRFNAKGLVQHDRFIEWIGDAVRVEVEAYNRKSPSQAQE
jgi:sirohydrochlorin cobaltochelatase